MASEDTTLSYGSALPLGTVIGCPDSSDGPPLRKHHCEAVPTPGHRTFQHRDRANCSCLEEHRHGFMPDFDICSRPKGSRWRYRRSRSYSAGETDRSESLRSMLDRLLAANMDAQRSWTRRIIAGDHVYLQSSTRDGAADVISDNALEISPLPASLLDLVLLPARFPMIFASTYRSWCFCYCFLPKAAEAKLR